MTTDIQLREPGLAVTFQGVITHHTRYGDLEVEPAGPFLYRVRARHLTLNGKPYVLASTAVAVCRTGWYTDTTHTLQRQDVGRRPTQRTKIKADRIVLDAALTAASHAGVTDLQVSEERWKQELSTVRQIVEDQASRLDHFREQARIAECHVLAHTLPGAAGEIARVLTRDGWPHSPEDLYQAATSLTG